MLPARMIDRLFKANVVQLEREGARGGRPEEQAREVEGLDAVAVISARRVASSRVGIGRPKPLPSSSTILM